MRRIVIWLMSTLTALVLLFSYHTSTASTVEPTRQISQLPYEVGSSATRSPTVPASPSVTAQAAAGASGSAQAPGQIVTGQAISTRYGAVQVQITVVAGKVTAASVVQVPWTDRHDQQINGRAVPILNQEAIAAQSAQIDMVSGATITSQAYRQSLQSALDQARR